MEHVRNKLAIDRVFACIGGTHLGKSPESEINSVVEAFEQVGVRLLAPAHCTGARAKSVLESHFGSRFCAARAGDVFEF